MGVGFNPDPNDAVVPHEWTTGIAQIDGGVRLVKVVLLPAQHPLCDLDVGLPQRVADGERGRTDRWAGDGF